MGVSLILKINYLDKDFANLYDPYCEYKKLDSSPENSVIGTIISSPQKL